MSVEPIPHKLSNAAKLLRSESWSDGRASNHTRARVLAHIRWEKERNAKRLRLWLFAFALIADDLARAGFKPLTEEDEARDLRFVELHSAIAQEIEQMVAPKRKKICKEKSHAV